MFTQTNHSTFYFPIRLTARAERYCGGEPLIQLLLDDVAKERCRKWIEEICNSQAKKINECKHSNQPLNQKEVSSLLNFNH